MQDFKINTQFESEIIQILENNSLANTNIDYQVYTIRHKQAFLATMYSLTKQVTQSAIMHDTDKLYLYGRVSKKETSLLHGKYAIHHIENGNMSVNKLDCIIDYECARFTKPDKPLNAYSTIMKFRPNTYDFLRPTLIDLGLDSDQNISIDFTEWNQVSDQVLSICKRDIIYRIALMKETENNSSLEDAEKVFYARDYNDVIDLRT